jgi:hypothetical protein
MPMPPKKREGQRMNRRAASVTAPKTIDEGSRTMRAVMTTEQPCLVFDWDRWDLVNEILLAKGMIPPGNDQVPLLDSHSRDSVANVLGSGRDFGQVQAGGFAAVDAEVGFASTDDAVEAFTKYQEGHLTDFSVGYEPIASVWIEDGRTADVEGKTYTGPVSVVTQWALLELSATPIGADNLAKARSKQKQGDNPMNKRLRKLLERRGLSPESTDEQARAFLEVMSATAQLELRAKAEKDDAGADGDDDGDGDGKKKKKDAPYASEDDDEGDDGKKAACDDDDNGKKAAKLAKAEIRKATERATAEERERISSITERCKSAGCPDMAKDLIAKGISEQEACRAILDKMSERSQASNVMGFAHIEVGKSDQQRFFAAAEDAIMVRSGRHVEKPAEGFQPLRGRTLVQLAEESLQRSGVNTRNMTNMEIAMAAVHMERRGTRFMRRDLVASTSSDFPSLLGNVVHRILRQAYDETPSTYEAWTHVVDAPDFRLMTRIALSEAPDLDMVLEGDEYKVGKLMDSQEGYQVAKYGKKFGVTWETIINDDLNALQRIPTLFGSAARRKVNTVVYGLLTGNPIMQADNDPLFCTAHNNYVASGSGAPVGITNLTTARAAMRTQKGLQGGDVILDIQPKYLIVPAAQETEIDIILRSAAYPEIGMSSGVVNPFQSKLNPIIEPRLDAWSINAWFLAAPWNQIDTMEVAFLDGQQAPWIEERPAFDTDGIEYKVRSVFGAKIIDYRGLYCNMGQ